MLLITKLITLAIICVAFILGVGNANTANATELSTTAHITNLNNENDSFDILVNASFKDKHKLLIINSPQYKNISIEKLKQDLGEKNVVEDIDLDQVTVNLKDSNTNDLHIHFNDTDLATINIYDIKQNKLATESFANPTYFAENSRADPYAWTKRDKLKVSYGNPIKKQSDGSILKPVIYFGSITNALNQFSVNESTKRDNSRSSRKNNITAANSGILVLNNTEKNITNNTFFTNTSGDGVQVIGTNGVTDDNRQSINNIVTSNLFNYREKVSDQTPNIAGPDYRLSSNNFNTGMNKNTASFWTRISKETGLEEQRMIFEQKYEIIDWNPLSKNPEYKVQVEIIQRFTKNNVAQTEITYKNIGNQNLSNFVGYSFRNITFNNSINGKNSTNAADIHSLGNNQGLYAFNKDLGADIEFDLSSHQDSPFAWKLSSNKPAYFGGANFVYQKNSDAHFENVDDQGYKTGLDPGAGQFFSNKNLKTLMMATKSTSLNINDKTHLAYSTKFDVIGKMNPNINIKADTSNQDPIVVENHHEKIKLEGSWFDYRNKNIDLMYTIDSANMDKADLLLHDSQTDAARQAGTIHNWKEFIDISKLSPGKHKIRVFGRSFAKDKSGVQTEYRSEIHEIDIFIKPEASVIPDVSILSPMSDSTIQEPFEINSDTITLSGIWYDLDSPKVNLYYAFNAGEKILFSKDAENKTPGRANKWTLNNLSLKNIKDTDLHTLAIYVDDGDSKTPGNEGLDLFFFQRVNGTFRIIAPQSINFGVVHAINKQQYSCQAKLPGKLSIVDSRLNKKNPLTLSLETGELSSNDSASLQSALTYKNQFVASGGKIILGTTKIKPGSSEIDWTDFTDHVEKELKFHFMHPHRSKTSSNHVTKYSSQWKFVVSETDSI